MIITQNNKLMEVLSESSSQEEWEVESILKERSKKTSKDKKTGRIIYVKEYLVKWKGYDEPTWEPEDNLEHCQEVLKDFLLSQIMKKLKSANNADKTKDGTAAVEPPVNKKNKKLSNKKRQSPDTPSNITDDEQEKSTSTVSNSLSCSYNKKNKKKKKEEIDVEEVKEIDMNYDIEIEKKEKPKSKDNISKEKFVENIKDNYIVINDDKNAEENNRDISGIKVLRINYMKIPEKPEDGIAFNIKFKKKGKTFIETFNTKNDNIPKECLAKYYEMFIRENFKGCVFSKEMLFE